LPKSASNNLRKWFLSPTGLLNFGFIAEGKLTVVLITSYSWGSQLVVNTTHQRFIVRSGEKALPFFNFMKRTRKFEWTLEADKAFTELKRYLTSPPIMVAPRQHEPLLLYIAATPRTASAVLDTSQTYL
jgi:hypothetical protein